jgi:hypothetical protein
MTTTAVIDRPEAPAGPPKLTHAQLREAQVQTLDAPRLRYGLLARALFKATDLVYGRVRTLVKFTMLEYIARPTRRGSGTVTWRLPATTGAPRWPGGCSSGSCRPAPSRTTSNGTC